MRPLDKKNIRYNIISMLIYIIGIIIIIKLFTLQIVNGKEYLEKSNSRLTRETTVKATRGNVLDCNGNILAGTKLRYSLELYKSKIETEELNNTILKVMNILEKNSDEYIDDFPISMNPIEYKYSNNDNIRTWLKNNNLDENLTAEEVLNKYIEKYELENYELTDARKIISVRYGIDKNGYSSMKPYIISDNISEQSILEFEEQSAGFPGINIENTPVRNYIYGSLASHVLGYTGRISEDEYNSLEGYQISDYIGKTGVEYVFEKYLKGEDGVKQTDMSVDGTFTGEYITQEAVSGYDVTLTIDAKIQEAAEKSLSQTIEKICNGDFGKAYDAKTGSAVVMNVKTGEVIALCSYPDFEPQLFVDGISTEKWTEYTQEGKSALINRAIQSAYAPGSVYKMVTAIAGIESGAITTTETIYDTGIYYYGGSSWRCWSYTDYGIGHGAVNVSGAIKHSCNYFFYETAKRMGIDTLVKYARYFGLGSKTGIELSGEEAGLLASKETSEKYNKPWYGGDTLNAAIGQGDNSFTPIQIAKYISMVANGGHDVDVTLLKEIKDSNGTAIDKKEVENYINDKLGIKKEEKENLEISKESIDAVLEGMKSVTTETGGTAYSVFKDFEIEVGGKTGSAEAGKNVNAWFTGFAPYDDPEIAVVVFVENGGHGYYTASVARAIFESYFGTTEEIKEDRTAKPYTGELN
ncbi:MAG: penicillin-binding protein 2 [Clostridia bacterium]